MSQIRVYLAWQRIKDGRVQIRKWSPDRLENPAQNRYMFMGFEAQSANALEWLKAHGEPTWPECIDAVLPAEPYCISVDSAEFKPWEPKKYIAPDEPVHLTGGMADDGLKRFLGEKA